ncbi:Transcription factor [Niveomyces insectorum RCEF 264]|uniref:Transcription factor n=1 Tax=Niveomyces insectorum RCEF 264 TaxID=1081102 RepID=A0A167SLL7_9HYPO|nr:Transcription factor [Niveomyces insectorum RCEF 264]
MSPSDVSEDAGSLPSHPGAANTGKRTKVACKNCHRRRVRCDAFSEQPCWHCRLQGTRCELIESRRGKYARKKATCDTAGSAATTITASATDAAPAATSPNMLSPDSVVFTPRAITDESRSPKDAAATLGHPPSPPTTVGQGESDQTCSSSVGEGPEMLYTRLVESDCAASPPEILSDNVRYYYMGEPFSLAFVVRSLSSNAAQSNSLRLHHPIPHTVAEHAHDGAEGLKESDPSVVASLNAHSAFQLPPQKASDELVRLFFETIHPAYPVFDRQQFSALYRQNKASLLALQTILYLALTVCSDETLKTAGFHDRYSARRTVYLRAKALYDMGCEKNKITLTAVLFLLGFWWEGPEDQKDSWHWLGAAISLAQTLGLHRSTANSEMPVRDRHAAAALGRPCRIHDDDCDVEMLQSADFLVDQNYNHELIAVEMEYHRSYAIEMARLAQILGRLLKREFAPRHAATPLQAVDVYQELQDWEFRLPPSLRRTSVDESFGAPFWSCMLHANYHNCQILLLRPKGSAALPVNHIMLEKSARVAADSITRIVEDLLAAGTMRLAQLHLVPALFAALSIHTIVIQRSDGVQKQLAENRARQCILALGELAKGWPVAGWILRLFMNLMKTLTGQSNAAPDGRASQQRNADLRGDNGSAAIQQATHSVTDFSKSFGLCAYPPVENGVIGDGASSLGQTNQLISDIIWAPEQADFDCDFMFGNIQVNNGSFPFHLG